MGEREFDKRTLVALEKSIEKWQEIANGIGFSNGKYNCPLCALFWVNDCLGCPVSEKTHRVGCAGTPYSRWDDHMFKRHNIKEEWDRSGCLCDICKELAENEVAFLKSLRPKTIGDK